NRLNMIHEGTHGIQALDLLGRKVLLENGALLAELGQAMRKSIVAATASGDPALAAMATELRAALERIGAVTQTLWRDGDAQAALAQATPYLQAFGHVVIGWIWLELATAAQRAPDQPGEVLRASLRHTARWYFAHELPRVGAWLQPAEQGDRSLLQTAEDWL
ncbi:MAG: acyl-CoA dehydrogenase, partial [Burkholderiaceae bacterium]|nr:acyl-CoA dehydrogenase [Burkholderiaceae bacterium]